MSNTEKIGRIHWSVTFTLSPGEARVRQDVRIANETAVESRYLYWANCGIPLKENTEYIYPETKGAMHGKYETVFSWPTYEGTNLALIKNLEEMLGVYMLEAREGFFGYFSHDDKAGLAHAADVNDLPGEEILELGLGRGRPAYEADPHRRRGLRRGPGGPGRHPGEVRPPAAAHVPSLDGVLVSRRRHRRLQRRLRERGRPVLGRAEVGDRGGRRRSASRPRPPVQDVSLVIKKGGETLKTIKEAVARSPRSR